MNRRTLGILATVVGSALGAWWITSQRRTRGTTQLRAARDHGTVIFDNTPSAAESEGIGKFVPLAFETPCIPAPAGPAGCAPNRFYTYGVVARLAQLAAAIEVEQLATPS